MTFRRAINRLHLWLGLATSLPLLVLCVTGTLLVFEDVLLRWEYRRFAPVTPAGERHSLQTCLDAARRACPDLLFTTVYLPETPRDAVHLAGTPKPDARASGVTAIPPETVSEIVSVDPYSATVIDRRPRNHGIMPTVRALHVTFLAGKSGQWVVGVSTIIFLLILASGLVLWFKRGGGWRKLLIKWDARGKRLQYDLHANFGFYSSAVLFVIGLSGVLIWIGAPWRNGLLKVTGSTWRERPTLPVSGQPTHAAAIVTLDHALAVADQASPETHARLIILPRSPKDPIAISRHFWWGTRPQLTVSVHPVNGALFDIDDPRQYESGHLIHRLNRGLHSGEIGTAAMRWVWFAASLVPVLLIWTGLKLWWKPRRQPAHAAVLFRPLPAATSPAHATAVPAPADALSRSSRHR